MRTHGLHQLGSRTWRLRLRGRLRAAGHTPHLSLEHLCPTQLCRQDRSPEPPFRRPHKDCPPYGCWWWEPGSFVPPGSPTPSSPTASPNCTSPRRASASSSPCSARDGWSGRSSWAGPRTPWAVAPLSWVPCCWPPSPYRCWPRQPLRSPSARRPPSPVWCTTLRARSSQQSSRTTWPTTPRGRASTVGATSPSTSEPRPQAPPGPPRRHDRSGGPVLDQRCGLRRLRPGGMALRARRPAPLRRTGRRQQLP